MSFVDGRLQGTGLSKTHFTVVWVTLMLSTIGIVGRSLNINSYSNDYTLMIFVFRLQSISLISVLLEQYKRSFGLQDVVQYSWFSVPMRILVKFMKR